VAASDAFTQKLIDAMPFVVDESTEHALISIFTVLLPYYEKTQPDNNLIIKEFLAKEQTYKEKLLYLTIRGSMYRLDKQMETLTVLFTNEQTKGKFFSDNDFGLIVDCCLRELESKNTARSRTQIMKVLSLILDNAAWMNNNMSRIPEFNQKLELIVTHEDEENAFTVKERE